MTEPTQVLGDDGIATSGIAKAHPAQGPRRAKRRARSLLLPQLEVKDFLAVAGAVVARGALRDQDPEQDEPWQCQT